MSRPYPVTHETEFAEDVVSRLDRECENHHHTEAFCSAMLAVAHEIAALRHALAKPTVTTLPGWNTDGGTVEL